ncbi:ATP-dependent exonuclase V beta subunit, helicase and exonuclease domain-containing [Rhizobium leguminosarum bv. trifolii WSM2297]|uniref:ATP-dependent exonuclase V beta subunit, helicase and exonuclease domain-containing n=1 Tax=Rhizobium leguminosarum bv. trifolii WSM2297 TaxID=754762 RepID=J0CJ53_RHILT|nr:flagellar biosynthetic protein FliO [Rhizobium leguminosarum]EJC79510.1 ATP-dependent exonuclase V beta subunit, helicase and exonuclease domain-containing [Rhizobium leguminosarum bv. trifolii WSM2297]
MLDDVVGAYGSRFLLAAGGVGLALLLLILVLWVIRSRAPSPFVRGGRNRQPRLQVLDAAAVDTRRRLVLVRRDDVEHLIMIGGPSDIVIESRILSATAEQPATADRPQHLEQPPISPARPETPPVSPPRIAVAAPVATPAAARVEPPAEPSFPAPVSPEPRPRPEPQAQPTVAPPVATSPLPANPVTAPLSAERDIPPPAPPQPRPPERTVAPPVAPAAFHDTASAAEILDAARQRVLPQQRIEPEVSAPSVQDMPAAARGLPGMDDAPAPPIRGDFQRVLEEEMSNNLMAERIVPVPANQAPRQAMPQPQPGNLPRRDPELPPITGADTELQKEVARIFGEMSVNRDK